MTDDLSQWLIAESPDAIIAMDLDGRVQHWNRGAEYMFGFTADESVGQLLSELVVPADRVSEEQRIVREVVESGLTIYESMRRRKDGSLVYVDISVKPLQLPDGRLLILYNKKDVTDLKVRRDAKLVQASFGQLLDSTPDGIILVNATGRVVLANRHAERLFGYGHGELLGKPIEALLPERFRRAHVEHRAGYIGQPRVRAMGAGLDLYGLRKDGDEFPVEISLSPLQTDEGTLIFSAIRDITERKRFERALRDTNAELERASAAKDRFLAGMSHELRTPLNAIIGFTGTLLMKLPGPLTTDQEKQLGTVQASARHLLAMINDLLDLAKIEAGKVDVLWETIDGVALIEEVAAALRPQADRKNLELMIESNCPRPSLRCDQRILRQILINLVNNAIKFTDHGRVLLRFEEHSGPDGRGYAFRVSDTGIGIHADDQARLFNAFSQVHSEPRSDHEGTGLGLHLCRKLADLVNARIEMDSVPAAGSTFSVLLSEE